MAIAAERTCATIVVARFACLVHVAHGIATEVAWATVRHATSAILATVAHTIATERT